MSGKVSALHVSAALAVLLLLIIGAGFYTIYQKLGSLESQVAEISENYERVSSDIEAIKAEIRESQEGVESINDSIESLSRRVGEIESKLGDVASLEDLERILQDVAEISAAIETLGERIAELEEAASGEEEQIQGLVTQLEDLRFKLEQLGQRVDQLYESLFFPATIVDGTGQTVIVSERPERVVSLAPSVTEALYYINALDMLVGVDDYSDFPPEVVEAREAGTIASIGGFWNPSIEAILELEPDLVIGVTSVPSHLQVKEVLEAYGIPVLLLPNNSLSDVRESLIMLGKATGKVSEAYTTALKFDMALAALGIVIGGGEPLDVAVVVWPNPLFVVGGGNWEDEIIAKAGGVNVYGDIPGWPQVSYESLVERNPDIIIIMSGAGVTVEDFIAALESQLGDAAYEITAVREGRVYVLQGAYNDSFARPSPRTALSAYVLAAIMSPEAFGLDLGDIPEVVSPDTLDVIELIRGFVDEEIVEFLGEALG